MAEIEEINHRTLEVNGINMHVAEKGSGPLLILLHGFPELWYSWRHQLKELSSHGYHVIAPDMRGYGDTCGKKSYNSYTIFHIVADIVALLDQINENQVYVVGHDFGAVVAWHLCLFRPDQVKALVALSAPYIPRNAGIKPVEYLRALYGENHYLVRFQEPEAAEAEFGRIGAKRVIKKFFSYREPRPLYLPKEGWGSDNEKIALPEWITEEDINYFASKFEKSGFAGPINYYRCLDLNWELTAPWTGVEIKVPVKFIVGDLDQSYNLPGMEIYIKYDGMKSIVPLLQEIVVMKGVGHFINQEKAQEISQHILDFIRRF